MEHPRRSRSHTRRVDGKISFFSNPPLAPSNTPRSCRPRAFDRLVTPPTITNLQIPAGRVLVITAFSWNLFQGATPSQSRAVSLFRAVGGAVNGPSAQSRALADSTGRTGASETFPTGLVVRPGEQLCLVIEDAGTFDKVTGLAYGFFAPDE